MRVRSIPPLLVLSLVAAPLGAQVAIHPTGIEPGAWERLALRVVNQLESPVVAVELTVPEVLTVLGLDAPPGWTMESVPAADTAAPVVRWTGGELVRGAFREFSLLVRLPSDARRRQLVFPVALRRADGGATVWGPGGDGRALVVTIRATTGVSAWGAFGFAGAAMGVAILALALALRRPRGAGG